jgi:hypothetical protein
MNVQLSERYLILLRSEAQYHTSLLYRQEKNNELTTLEATRRWKLEYTFLSCFHRAHAETGNTSPCYIMR